MIDVNVKKIQFRSNQQPSTLAGEGSEAKHETSTKACRVCKRELSLTSFNKFARNKGGLDHRCKECCSAYYKERRLRKKNDPILDAYEKEQMAKRNHKRRIKVAIDPEYRKQLLEKRRIWDRAWYARKGKFTKKKKIEVDSDYYTERTRFSKNGKGILAEVLKRDQVCNSCGSDKNLEFDHIHPVSKGGRMTKDNIQVLCRSCNRFKSDHLVLAGWQGIVRSR